MTSTSEKAALRKHLLQKRRSLPENLWQQWSEQICQHLRQSSQFTQAETVLAYFSFRQEPDLSSLFELPKNWGFPRCAEQSLIWHAWTPHDPLQTGAYGIPEPHPNAPVLSAAQVDLLLVPAVACDRQGFRLGYGGGFYDRLLCQPEWSHKPAIGIVFDQAYLPCLPQDPWDRALMAVCTESGLFYTE
jgi:5-formyltetrahydrofolate cyclo-ligase